MPFDLGIYVLIMTEIEVSNCLYQRVQMICMQQWRSRVAIQAPLMQ